jgi:hypothetical protein
MRTNNTTDSPGTSPPTPQSWLNQLRPRGRFDWFSMAFIAFILMAPLILSKAAWANSILYTTLFMIRYVDTRTGLFRSPRAERIFGRIGMPLTKWAKIGALLSIAVLLYVMVVDDGPWTTQLFLITFATMLAGFVYLFNPSK